MTKIVSSTKISTTFLAAILVAGTIAMISSSFMTHAQAFVMENNNYQKKSFGKDISVKYIKCNNINVNVNGFSLDIGTFPGLLGGEVGAASETETGTNSFGNNGPSGSNGGFVFVCINNNNNGGTGDGDEIDACVDCIIQNLNPTQLSALQTELEKGISIALPNNVNEIIHSLEELCSIIENSPVPQNQLGVGLSMVLSKIEISPESDQYSVIFNCIAEALDIPIPPPP